MSREFVLANNARAQGVIQRSKATGVTLFVFDRKSALSPSIAFLYQKLVDSPNVLDAYVKELHKYDPLLPNKTAPHRNCKQFSGISERKNLSRQLLETNPSLAESKRFWNYFSQVGFTETGISIQSITDDVFLAVGLHATHQKKHIDIDAAANELERWLLDTRDFILDRSIRACCSGLQINPRTDLSTRHAERFTRRESLVVCELMKGQSNKEIAYALGLSEYSVQNHLRRLYGKFHVHNRTALIAQINQLMEDDLHPI